MGHNGALGRSQTMGCPRINQTLRLTEDEILTFEAFDTGKTFMGETIVTTSINENGREVEEEVYQYRHDRVNKFLTPGEVEWLENPMMPRQVLSVSLGKFHMLVVARESSDGKFAPHQTRVYSCGQGGLGQLGHGGFTEKHQLTPVKALDGKMISKVAAGSYHSMALDMFGQKVYAWGDPYYGVLGLFDEDHQAYVTTPEEVAFPESLGNSCIVDIEAGYLTSFAITQDGRVYSWGLGEEGATGHPGDEDARRPKLLNVMRRIPENGKCQVLRVSGGGQHTLMLINRCK